MSQAPNDDEDISHNEYWDKGIIFVAALLTLCAIGVCFFQFTITPAKKAAGPTTAISGEVTVGISTHKASSRP